MTAAIVLHLVVDWLLQNDWMAKNKMNLRHPAGYVHAGLHGLAMLLVFPIWAALIIAVTHLLIDTRWPVEKWSKLIRQTQPSVYPTLSATAVVPPSWGPAVLVDVGMFVRFWSDQVWHIGVIALMWVIV